MIVTRKRRKPFPWKKVALPILAAALLIAAFSWPPSQNWILNGPLAPVWRAVAPVTAPFHLAAQQRTISDQGHQIAALQKQLSDEKSQIADRDKQIASLQKQLDQAQTQVAQAQSPSRSQPSVPQKENAQAPAFETASSSGSVQSGDLSQGATPDMRRVAAQWSSMDADAAAKVVQKLPLSYVARVFALMSPDAAGAILQSLTPAYAAELTQEHPELRR
ncbi:MAG: MotE family protein [Vulcanimicrobiaceae bacterium]